MTRRRSTAIFIYTLGVAFCQGTRMMLPPILPSLQAQLEMGHLRSSWLMTGFLISYALMQAMVGGITARVGRRRTIAVGIGVYSAATLLIGVSRTYWQLLVLQILGGLGAGVYFITGLYCVGKLATPEHRGRIAAMFMSGGKTGELAATVFVGIALQRGSWRAAYTLWSTLGLAVMAAIALLLPKLETGLLSDAAGATYCAADHRRSRPATRSATRPRKDLASCLTSPPYLILTVAFVLNAVRTWGYTTFLPEFLISQRGFQTAAANAAYTMTLVVAALAQMAGGVLCDRFGPVPVTVVSNVLAGASTMALVLFTGRTAALIEIAVVSAMSNLAFLANLSAIMASLPEYVQERGTGLSNGLSFVGAALGPALVGRIIDVSGFARAFAWMAAIAWIGHLLAAAAGRLEP